MAHVFISYSRKDQDYARRVEADLLARGFDVWIDDRIDYGDRWWRTIVEAIEACAAFVVIMSPEAERSEWVEREILVAQREEKPIFPLLLRGREFSLLITTQFADVSRPAGRPPLPPDDFYDRLRSVIAPADHRGASVAPQPEPRTRPAWWGIGAAGVAVVVLVVGWLLIANGGDGGSGTGNLATDTPHPLTEIAYSNATAAVLAQTATADSYTDTPTMTPTEPPDFTATYHWYETVAVQNDADTLTPTSNPAHTATHDTQGVNLDESESDSGNTEAVLEGLLANDTPETSVPTARERALALAAQGVTANAAWTPYTEAIGGVEMALVPAGCFMMGSEDGDSNERPVHEVCFEEPFWIDVYEVTNEQYGSVSSCGYSSQPDQPRNCVNWPDAAAFCEARGARLLTEAEWEYAARGPDGLVYPWGDEWDPARANWADTAPDETFAVGSFPTGASWAGALDLAGNVWEWVADWYVSSYPEGRQVNPSGPENGSSRVLRGGSFNVTTDHLRAANRGSGVPVIEFYDIGFRCALAHSSGF